jgi:hypothetical protein
MSLSKITETVGNHFIKYTKNMIKNGSLFSINSYDILYKKNNKTIYLNHKEMIEFLYDLFNIKINFKQWPQKVLKSMKKNNFILGKQPIELLLVFITYTKNDVYYYVSIPEYLNINIDKLIEGLDYRYINSTKTSYNRIQLYGSMDCEFPLKHKDIIQLYFLHKFKEIKIYEEIDSD